MIYESLLYFVARFHPDLGQYQDIRNIDYVSFHPDNNSYIVEQDIIVPKGKIITIPEGVVLLFHPFSGLRVDGRLNVMGSEEKLVIFSGFTTVT